MQKTTINVLMSNHLSFLQPGAQAEDTDGLLTVGPRSAMPLWWGQGPRALKEPSRLILCGVPGEDLVGCLIQAWFRTQANDGLPPEAATQGARCARLYRYHHDPTCRT